MLLMLITIVSALHSIYWSQCTTQRPSQWPRCLESCLTRAPVYKSFFSSHPWDWKIAWSTERTMIAQKNGHIHTILYVLSLYLAINNIGGMFLHESQTPTSHPLSTDVFFRRNKSDDAMLASSIVRRSTSNLLLQSFHILYCIYIISIVIWII